VSGKKWFGWAGKVLRVNLSTEKVTKLDLSEELAHNFLGGRGFNIKVLWDELKSGIDPLSPENLLCFGTGPLVGTLLGESCRYNISCKSALTGLLGDGNAGGWWGASLKQAGYDQIVVTGRASRPVYLWIEDDSVEIKSAGDIWGKTTWEATDVLRERHGLDVRVNGVGQSGENLVRSSCTVGDSFRFGTRGSGAVWGSKNLKAIAVRGTEGVKISDPDSFEKLCVADHEKTLQDEEIQGFIGVFGATGLGEGEDQPWKDDNDWIEWSEWSKRLWGEQFYERFNYSVQGCFNCAVHCTHFYEIEMGDYAGTRGGGPQFPQLIQLGLRCGILDLSLILKINNLFSQYGLCTYAAPYVLSLAIDLYKNGIITKNDTGGMKLEWGDDESIIEMVHQLALREGFGNKLAEGAINFAKLIGKGADKYLSHVKGLGKSIFSYFEPVPGFQYLVSTRGADHLRASLRLPDECVTERGLDNNPITYTFVGQHEKAVADCIGRCICAFNTWRIGVPLADPLGEGRAKVIHAATGWNASLEQIDRIGERIYNLEKAIIVREGIMRKHDHPSERSYTTPLPGGKDKGKILEREFIDGLLDDFYNIRGWDVNTGVPTESKLRELGLGYVAKELAKNMPYPEWTGPVLWSLEKYPSGGERAEF
jgi:aldehyde:ferredoxin oxidoreductase